MTHGWTSGARRWTLCGVAWLALATAACQSSPAQPTLVTKGEAEAHEDTVEDEARAAKAKKAKAKKGESKSKGRSHRYKGQAEAEVEKPLDEFGEIDQWTLKLRKKQPIRFLGLPMRQIPTDNWLMSELMHKLEPDYVIEAGTLYGGSAVYYAAMLEFINPEAKVLTIDINAEQIHEQARQHPLWQARVKFYEGSSVDPAIHEQLRAEIGEGKKVLVTLDTLHAPRHVAKELEMFSKLVSRGSYMILQDTYYEGLPEVVDEFLADNPDWVRDEGADTRFIFTKYRGGFLRKK